MRRRAKTAGLLGFGMGVGAVLAMNACTLLVGLRSVPAADDDGDAEDGPAPGDASSDASDATSPTSAEASTTPDGTLGDSTNPQNTVADSAATDATPASDTSASDATTDAADAASSPEAGPPVNGTDSVLVLAGTSLKIKGMTTDGWILYNDSSAVTTQDYKVISSTAFGSDAAAPIEVQPVPNGADANASVIGQLAFTWAAGELNVWSSSMSAPVIVSDSAVINLAWASPDSRHFVYVDATESSGAGHVYGVDIADGGSIRPTALAPISNASDCGIQVVFAGAYVVIGSCPTGTSAMLSSYVVTNGWQPALDVPETIATVLVDPGATQAAVPAPSFVGASYVQVFSLDGAGSAFVLDPNSPFFDGPTAVQSTAGMGDNPWSILYDDQSGVLWRASASGSPPPALMVDAGVNGFNALSPSSQWLQVSNTFDQVGHPRDLSLASTTEAGTPRLLAASAPTDVNWVEPFFQSGIGYTLDESFATFYTEVVNLVSSTNQRVQVGQYNAMQTSPPYTVISPIATKVFDDISLANSTQLVLANTRFETVGDSDGVFVDLETVDLAGSDGGTTLVPIVGDIPREIAVTSDHTHVAYVVTQGLAPGIYLAPIPGATPAAVSSSD
jgi:hypothetical protein